MPDLPKPPIDRESPVPFYFQLAEVLEAEIRSGRWEPAPFTGDVGRLASVVMTEFGAYLDSYDFLPTKSGSDH